MVYSYRSVALYGAGGDSIGHHILQALLANSQFTITIIARSSSTTKFPSSVRVVRIPASPSHSNLVEAFEGQDVLISAVGFPAQLSQHQLIDAAIEAGVKRFVPSDYGMDNMNPEMRKLSPVFESKGAVIDYLRAKEGVGLTWTSVATGLWLDWALRPEVAFMGINPSTHMATLIDDGKHLLSFTTLSFAANGVVQTLVHPDLTANKIVPIRAFETSPHDVLRLLEKFQGVKYQVTMVHSEDIVKAAKQVLYEERPEPPIDAIVALTRVGILATGFPNNLLKRFGDDELKIGKELELEELGMEDVVQSVVDGLQLE